MLEELIPKDFSQELLLEWVINIGLAIIVFIIGRIVANVIVKIARHAMTKGGMDSLLINFI